MAHVHDEALLQTLNHHDWSNGAIFTVFCHGAGHEKAVGTMLMLRKHNWQATIWNEMAHGTVLLITPYIPEEPERPKARRKLR